MCQSLVRFVFFARPSIGASTKSQPIRSDLFASPKFATRIIFLYCAWSMIGREKQNGSVGCVEVVESVAFPLILTMVKLSPGSENGSVGQCFPRVASVWRQSSCSCLLAVRWKGEHKIITCLITYYIHMVSPPLFIIYSQVLNPSQPSAVHFLVDQLICILYYV